MATQTVKNTTPAFPPAGASQLESTLGIYIFLRAATLLHEYFRPSRCLAVYVE